jgi:catechol 2,3-dioxygenase-like lactoylglutathione lyase family enzyme
MSVRSSGEAVDVESRMVRRDGVTIELLGFLSPGVTGDGGRRPMNRRGLTHLSLRVDDVEEVSSTIERLGGTVVRTTRTTFDLPGVRLDFLYCTDPDGVRIELMDLPD